MNLKKIIPIITAVLAFCVVAVIVVLNTKDSPSSTPSNSEQLQSTPSESESATDNTEETIINPELLHPTVIEFKEMLTTASDMLASGGVIAVNKHEYTWRYLAQCRGDFFDAISFTDKTYSIDMAKVNMTAEQSYRRDRDLRYFLLLTQVMEKYSDCVVLRGDLIPDPSSSFDLPPKLYLCTAYKNAGYETAEAFYNAVTQGEYTGAFSIFELNLIDATILRYGDTEHTNLYKELIAE